MATIHKNLSEYKIDAIPNVSKLRFGIVVSEWNEDITENLYKGAYNTLVENGVLKEHIYTQRVPGTFELTFGCKTLLESKNFDAVIAIGSVIQGETKHFDFVCNATANGIKDLNVKYSKPTIFCVLTDNNKQQAIERSGGIHGNKGIEAAIVALKMSQI